MDSQLPPMNKCLEFLLRPLWPLKNLDDIPLRQLATLELWVQPHPAERVFRYHIRLAYTLGQGCCYMASDQPVEPSLLGQSVRRALMADAGTCIATLDSIYASSEIPALHGSPLIGEIAIRGRNRASFIASNTKEYFGLVTGDTVLLIGAVGEITRAFQELGLTVIALDLEDELVGRSFHGNVVKRAECITREIVGCSAVLATAMTLWNNSIDAISELARAEGIPLILYAHTGANLAPHLIGTSIAAVFREQFPFYVMGSSSTIEFCVERPPQFAL